MLRRLFHSYLSHFFPKFLIHKLRLGDIYICSLSEYLKNSDRLFVGISCGAGHSWQSALIKAYSEYVERRSSSLSGAQSTTGFAAFPFIFRKKRAQRKARQNAYFEMVERYAWPEWFYNNKAQYQVRANISENNKKFYEAISSEINFLKLYAITPKLGKPNLKMVILYAATESGLVCGGAVRESEEKAEQNALKELYMHAAGLYRMRNNNVQAATNYEKRVDWISKQHPFLEKRLAFSGNEAIIIPSSVIFQDIQTEFHQFYVVQRCLFEGYDKKFISENNEMYV